jgi:hypothetical protein
MRTFARSVGEDMTRQPPIDRVTWIVVGLVFGFAMIRGVVPALVRGERVGLALLALGSMVAALVLPRIVARVCGLNPATRPRASDSRRPPR